MKTILIIDDDMHIGDMLKEVLEREGYGVLRAYSGTEALLLLSSERPDLILLDGGRGHVNAIAPIIAELAPDIALFGMVKDSKHRTRAIATSGGEISISGTQNAFHLLTRIQDEVHRFAITYHSLLKRKSMLK